MSTLFEKLYNSTEGIKKALLQPTVKRKIEREFQSYYDKLAERAGDAVDAIMSEYKKIGTEDSINIGKVIENRILIEDAAKNQEICASEYKIIFGTELKGVTVEEIKGNVFNEDGSIKIESV